MSFNSLRNTPAQVSHALQETDKLVAKLSAKKATNAELFFKKYLEVKEDCGKCYGCVSMRSVCTGEIV
jgi:hypothetical protein